MIFVVDASVAAKWFIEEESSEAARRLLDHLDADTAALHAPDLIIAEMGNLLWRKCRVGELTQFDAEDIMRSLPRYLTKLEPMTGLAAPALALAHELGRPIYDCLYLSCAVALQAIVITADLRFSQIVADTPHAQWLRFVDAIPAAPRH